MRPIKITDNREQVEEYLEKVNPRAIMHVFSKTCLEYAAAECEKRVAATGLNKRERIGAKAKCLSGEKMPTAYKYTRRGNGAVLVRKTRGWYIESITAIDLWPSNGGNIDIYLTAKQNEIAVRKFRKQYFVMQTVTGDENMQKTR